MSSASDEVEIFYLDDMEDEIVVAEMGLRRGKVALDIRFYSDAREVLAELGRRRKAAARLPGLIVSDLNMPGMDGIQLARKLRADKAYRDMVVGICTGSENPADHAAASAAGADFVVIKPLDRRTLARICETTGRFELVQEEGGWTRIRQAAA